MAQKPAVFISSDIRGGTKALTTAIPLLDIVVPRDLCAILYIIHQI